MIQETTLTPVFELIDYNALFVILSLLAVFPVIVILFRLILLGWIDFILSFVTRVKKQSVIDLDAHNKHNPVVTDHSLKGTYDLALKFKKMTGRLLRW